jgi:branched-chain amino acid transport system substrate-binding protein
MRINRRNLIVNGAAAALALTTLNRHASAQSRTQGVSDTEILLGSHQDLSGPVAALGSPLRDGMLLAVDDINAAGGINGRQLRMLVEDTAFDPKKAVLATEKLVGQDKVFAMIACLGSAPVQASMPLMLDANVPVLFSGTPAEFTYTPFHRIKFGMNLPYGIQVRAMVRYAVEKMGKKRIGILYQDDETGQSVLRATEEQLKAHNMTLVEQTSYKRGAIDFASQIAKLKAANVDLIVLGTIIRETAGACIEAKKQGWNVDMMVTLAGANSAVVKIGGAAVEGLYAMTQFVALNAQAQTPALQGVLARYQAKYKKDPDDGLIYGYTSVQLFAEAARRAGRNLNVDTLVAGLEQIKGWSGVFEAAPVSFAPNEHLGARSGILTRVKDGKFMPITGALTY